MPQYGRLLLLSVAIGVIAGLCAQVFIWMLNPAKVLSMRSLTGGYGLMVPAMLAVTCRFSPRCG